MLLMENLLLESGGEEHDCPLIWEDAAYFYCITKEKIKK